MCIALHRHTCLNITLNNTFFFLRKEHRTQSKDGCDSLLPVAMTKYPRQTAFKRKGLFWLTVQSFSPQSLDSVVWRPICGKGAKLLTLRQPGRTAARKEQEREMRWGSGKEGRREGGDGRVEGQEGVRVLLSASRAFLY